MATCSWTTAPRSMRLSRACFHQLRPAVQQLGGGGDQLVPGQEHMAVVLVVAQLKGHRRLEPLVAVRRQSHAHGHLVRDGEVHAADLAGEEVGILPHHLQRPRRRTAAAARMARTGGSWYRARKSISRRRPMCWRKLSAISWAFRAVMPLMRGQPLRLPLQNVQGLRAEPLHDPPGGGGAHALADAGGQVAEDLLLVLRQASAPAPPPGAAPRAGGGSPSMPETARCSPGATQGMQPTTVITSPSSVRRRRTV